MSISLVGVVIGLPIALAAHAILGEEKLNEWLRATDVVWKVDLNDMEAVKATAYRAGYDFQYWDWGASYKTHFRENSSSFFTWEYMDHGVIARMSIFDDQTDVQQLIERMEAVAGRKLFTLDGDTSVEQTERITQGSQSKTVIRDQMQTVYTDQGLLEGILLQYGIDIESSAENNILCRYSDYKMLFQRSNAEEPFHMEIETTQQDMRKLHECMKKLEAEYYASLQEQTYTSIREQILEEGMEIEEEQVMEDDSIVLTVAVK